MGVTTERPKDQKAGTKAKLRFVTANAERVCTLLRASQLVWNNKSSKTWKMKKTELINSLTSLRRRGLRWSKEQSQRLLDYFTGEVGSINLVGTVIGLAAACVELKQWSLISNLKWFH